jgi:hypothetical protein
MLRQQLQASDGLVESTEVGKVRRHGIRVGGSTYIPYVYSYLRTWAAYDSTVKAMGFDEVRVRYRQERKKVVRNVFLRFAAKKSSKSSKFMNEPEHRGYPCLENRNCQVLPFLIFLSLFFVRFCLAGQGEAPLSWKHGDPVVIIGAGITGLTTGILLKEQGIPVKIYEKRKRIESIGGALSVWPIGTKVLFQLPCSMHIAKLAGTLRYENWGNSYGDTLLTVDRENLQEINDFPFMNLCRSELQLLLLETFGMEDIVFNAKCTKIEKTDDAVFVYFDQERTKASLVILNFSISKDRQMIYAACPLTKDQLKQYRTRKEQIDLFSGWSKEVDRVFDVFKACQDDPEFSSHYFCNENYDMKPLEHWHGDRVVLLGDAAHPMGSINGFAANIALEDAQVLVNALISSEIYKMLLRN